MSLILKLDSSKNKKLKPCKISPIKDDIIKNKFK